MIQKIMAGALGVLLLVLGFVYWQKEAAESRADQLEQRNATLAQTAEDNAAEAERLQDEMEALGDRLTQHEQERRRLRDDLQTARTELSEAMETGNEQAQVCRDTRLPDAVVDRLREHARAGDEAQGGAGDGQ